MVPYLLDSTWMDLHSSIVVCFILFYFILYYFCLFFPCPSFLFFSPLLSSSPFLSFPFPSYLTKKRNTRLGLNFFQTFRTHRNIFFFHATPVSATAFFLFSSPRVLLTNRIHHCTVMLVWMPLYYSTLLHGTWLSYTPTRVRPSFLVPRSSFLPRPSIPLLLFAFLG